MSQGLIKICNELNQRMKNNSKLKTRTIYEYNGRHKLSKCIPQPGYEKKCKYYFSTPLYKEVLEETKIAAV